MFLRRKADNARVRGRDLNELIDVLNWLANVSGGEGIRVRTGPPGLGIAIDRARVQTKEAGGTQVQLARLWTYGPHEEGNLPVTPSRPSVKSYWVREVEPLNLLVKTSGFWEPAYNLAEHGISGTPFFFDPMLEMDDADSDIEHEWNVRTATHVSGWTSPIVPTWQIPRNDPNSPYLRVFFMWPFRFMQEAMKSYYGFGYPSERSDPYCRLTPFFLAPL